MGKHQKHNKHGALKYLLSREEQIEMLFKHLQNLGPEGAQYSKDDVKRWFESNALGRVMIDGRCMSDVLADCLPNKTHLHGNSGALVGSDQCLRDRGVKLMKCPVDGIDRTVYNVVGSTEIADMAFCSNVPSALDSLLSTLTVSSPGYSCDTPGTVPKIATRQARVLRGRSNGSDAEPAGAVRLAVKSTLLSSGYRYLSDMPGKQCGLMKLTERSVACKSKAVVSKTTGDACEQDYWLNNQFGNIQTLDMLFPLPTDGDNELLDMKPLRIPTDEKWLESYLSDIGDGKPPQPVGPHHPGILALEPIRCKHTFIKRPLETSELVPQ